MTRDQVSRVLHEPTERLIPSRTGQRERKAQMDAAFPEMPERDATQVVLRHEVVEVSKVVGQMGGGHSRVLPPGPGLATIGQPRHQPCAGLPDPPQRSRLGRVVDDP